MAHDQDLLRRWSDDDLPAVQDSIAMNPTLIFSWFCTIYAIVIIIVRLLGRWIRTEKMFREDMIMFWSLVPLLLRMGLVHVVLLWGTNATETSGLAADDIDRRSIGSRVVLASRICYAVFIWMCKFTVLEFFQRIVGAQSWNKIYAQGLIVVYATLILTLVGVIISTLAACRPFDHYWQVVPTPSSACWTGSAQLLTMGILDIFTNLILMAFPIPIVFMSNMRFTRKLSLTALFLLSIFPMIVTAYRIPSVMNRHFSQQFRSLMASLEILVAAAVANAIAIGSFLRDRGVKKVKYRAASVDCDVSILSRQPTQPTRATSVAMQHWGSDEDLVKDLGLSVSADLRRAPVANSGHRPASAVVGSGATSSLLRPVEPAVNPEGRGLMDPKWTFRSNTGRQRRSNAKVDDSSTESSSDTYKLDPIAETYQDEMGENSNSSDSKNTDLGFSDVGGLIASNPDHSTMPTSSQSHANLLSDIGGLLTTPSRTRP